MNLAEAKDYVAVLGGAVGGVVALSTLLKSLAEYQKQGAQKRAEQFLTLRDRYADFADLFPLLEEDAVELKDQLYERKIAFLGFHEELALLVNSQLMRQEVAHYMFGYYAMRCWKSANFWSGLNRDSIYWAAFADFAKRMEQMQKAFVYTRSGFRV
jgi:hypothetical protein